MRIETPEEYREWVRRYRTLATQYRPTPHDSYLPPESEPDTMGDDYAEWIRRYDTISTDDRKVIESYVNDLIESPNAPIISIIMVVDDPEPCLFDAAITSVREQIYPRWELIIVTNPTPDRAIPQAITEVLDRHCTADSRITQIDPEAFDPDTVDQATFNLEALDRKTRLTRSDALNLGLAAAHGTYIGILESEDLLRPHSLAWVASELIAHQDTVLLYTDHDQIDPQGLRHDHHFKSDWNLDLIRCQDYIGQSIIFAIPELRGIGGFHSHLTHHPTWDATLRLSLDYDSDRFRHIPAILYHVRSRPSETLPSLATEAITEAKALLSRHLEALGIPFELDLAPNGCDLIPTFAVQGSPTVSIIIPTRNGLEDLRACVESLNTTEYDNYDVVVVDNASDDPATLVYLAEVGQRPRHRVIPYPHAFDYATLHNTVIGEVGSDYICLLNNDTEILNPQWLGAMLGYAQLPGVGAVGAKLLYPDGTVQHAGVIVGLGGIAAHAHLNFSADDPGYHGRAILPQTLSAVTAACMLIKRDVYEELGGMDTELPIAFNDVDLCLRLRESGYRNIFQPRALLRHYESKSRGKDTKPAHEQRALREHTYMRWKWGTDLLADPYYNPNLTLDESTFGIGPSRVTPPWFDVIQWYTMPESHNFGHSQPLPLFSGDTLRARCVLPQKFKGTIELIQIRIGAPSGILSGDLTLAATIANTTVTRTEALDGHRGEFAFTFRIGDEPGVLLANPREILKLELQLTRASEPIWIPLYATAPGWGHEPNGLSQRALRLTLAVGQQQLTPVPAKRIATPR